MSLSTNHHCSRGTSKSAHNARHTSRGSTPASIACAAVRPPNRVSTWSTSSEAPRTAPNCPSTSSWNSVSRTPPSYPARASHPLRIADSGGATRPTFIRDLYSTLAAEGLICATGHQPRRRFAPLDSLNRRVNARSLPVSPGTTMDGSLSPGNHGHHHVIRTSRIVGGSSRARIPSRCSDTTVTR